MQADALPTDAIQKALKEAVRSAYARKYPRARLPVAVNALVKEFGAMVKPLTRLGQRTVERFFGDIGKSNRGTLDALAQYAGFADFSAFATAKRWELAAQATDRTARMRWAFGQLQELRECAGLELRARLAETQVLLAQPLWQTDWLQSFVDLAYLSTGYYGTLVVACYQQGGSIDPLFCPSLLYLRAWLQNDLPGCWHYAERVDWQYLRYSASPFLMGRVAFVNLAEHFHLHPQPLSAAGLQVWRERAPAYPPNSLHVPRPGFYNYFPAGYHFLVAEALFVHGQWPALATWLAETATYLTRLEFEAADNVFGEVLAIWQAISLLHTGNLAAAQAAFKQLGPSLNTPHNRWLWDYYEVYWLLAKLAFAAPDKTAIRNQVYTFADRHQMPRFVLVARTIELHHAVGNNSPETSNLPPHANQ